MSTLLDDLLLLTDDDGEDKKATSTIPIGATTTTATAQQQQQASAAVPAPPTKKKINDGPYNIGDRIVLKSLVSDNAKELNGRHGVIADLWDKKTERYPIDLDLLDSNRTTPLSVKVTNLERESPIPNQDDDGNEDNNDDDDDDKEKKRAKVVNGCLLETEARTVSFIFNALRGSIQNTLKGEKDPMKLAAFGWQFWDQGSGKGVYPSLKEFLTKGILSMNKLEDLEKQLNSNNPRGAYQKVTRAMSSPLAVGSWNVRIEGQFWIVGMSPEGTLVIPVSNPRQVYNVLGYKAPLGAQGKFPRPPKFYLTLLPWYGRLIHDPMLMTTTGTNQVELASPQLAMELINSCKLAKEEGRVVDRLAQLEVEGGSKVGLPFQPFVPDQVKDFMAIEKAKATAPATDKERDLVDNLADFESMPEGDKASTWTVMRLQVTEELNPNHTVVIFNNSGKKLHEFKSKDLIPTSEEVLKAILTVCSSGETNHKRPRLIGVDVPPLAMRLKFLFNGVKDINAVIIQVNREKPKTSD